MAKNAGLSSFAGLSFAYSRSPIGIESAGGNCRPEPVRLRSGQAPRKRSEESCGSPANREVLRVAQDDKAS